MWTKFVNWLGFETKAQQEEFDRAKEEVLRQARIAQRERRMAEQVIRTKDVPIKRPKPMKPGKSTAQVRAERYGTSQDEAYLTPGFNSYYAPIIMDPGGYDYDYMETSFPSVSSPSAPESDYSDYGRHHAYDSTPSSSTSYDPPASSSYSYDPPASSSYDSGSSSSYDSGSSGGGSFGE